LWSKTLKNRFKGVFHVGKRLLIVAKSVLMKMNFLREQLNHKFNCVSKTIVEFSAKEIGFTVSRFVSKILNAS